MSKPTRTMASYARPGDNFRQPVRLITALIDLYGLDHELGERHPRTRTGERKQLPPHIWPAVYHRDIRWPCQLCGQMMRHDRPELLHVDHVTPWSAGGSDETDNLRLTHAACNELRSNRSHSLDAPQLLIVHHCRACYTAWHATRDDDDVPTDEVWCDNCRRVGFGRREWGI